MMNVRYVAMEFVDTLRVSDADLEGAARIDPWCADGSVEESESIAQRNRDICQRLKQYFPDAQAADDVEELDEFLEGDLSQEAVVRRLHRTRALRAQWKGGEFHIRLFDRIAEVLLPVVDLTREARPAFAADLAECLRQLSTMTGMAPRDPLSGRVTSAELATSSVLIKNAPSLDLLARQVTRSRRRRRLGPASLAILGLLALALSWAIMAEALRRGTLMLHVDPSLPQTFVTESLGTPVYRLGVFPKFSLEGRAGPRGEWVRLPVYRNEYLRAGPGAPYTVLPTFRPETPYVLRSDYESAGPILPMGGSGLAWFAALAIIPPLLIYWITIRPILRAVPVMRPDRIGDASRHLGRLALIIGVILVTVWVSRFT